MANEKDETKSSNYANLLESLMWLNREEREKLKGEVLANSQILGYELIDLKNNILQNNIEKGNKFAIGANIISNTKFVLNKEKGDKWIFSNGLLLRVDNSSKYLVYGLGINYVNSILKDYSIAIKKEGQSVENNVIQGNVISHNIGTFAYGAMEYKDGFLSGILNTDLILKNINRGIRKEETQEIETKDMAINLNLQGGYKFKLLKNKLNISPYLGLDTTLYVKGSFEEDLEFGYASETEVNVKVKGTLGLKGRYNINEKVSIGFNTSYSKYLTDPTLKSKTTLKAYKFKEEIKGIRLEDNVINYGIDVKYNVTDKLKLSVSYLGKI